MLTCTLGAIALAFSNKEIPDIVVAIGSAAIGALAGLFAPSATSNQWVRLTAVPLNSLALRESIGVRKFNKLAP